MHYLVLVGTGRYRQKKKPFQSAANLFIDTQADSFGAIDSILLMRF